MADQADKCLGQPLLFHEMLAMLKLLQLFRKFRTWLNPAFGRF